MNELEKIKKDNKEITLYFRLLPKNSNIEWDKEDVNVDITTREKYLNELRAIYKLRKMLKIFSIPNSIIKLMTIYQTINYF